MKVLLTGATGLIGQAVGQELVRRGHQVIALSRDAKRAKETLTFPCEVRTWRGYNQAPQFEKQDTFDTVIHLSGESIAEKRWSAEEKKKIRDSRIVGTRTLAEAVAKQGVQLKTWVQGSAVGYYGDQGDTWLGEDAKAGNDFLAEVVKDWEAEAEKFQKQSGHRLVSIRTGIVFSAQGGALTKLFDVFHKGIGARLGDGKQFMSWIHITDIANLFVFAAEKEAVSGAVNGTAPEPVTNAELTSKLAHAMGRSEFIPVPKFALKVALGEMSQALLGSTRAKSRAAELGFQFHFKTLDSALADLCEGMSDRSRVLQVEQFVAKPIEEVYPFFSSEKNLEVITPAFLNFKVLDSSTEKVQKDTLINYKLSIHGIPVKWKTLIETWEPPHRFVDTQLSGPYQKWHHTHAFEKLGNGTLLRDRVLFKLPLGQVGDLAAGWKVMSDVQQIFKFRRTKILELFA